MFLIMNTAPNTLSCIDKPGITADKKLTRGARLLVGSLICDALLFITGLVLGILGVKGLVHGMSTGAGYAFIGICGVVALSWIRLTVVTKGKIFNIAKEMLQAAVSSDPKWVSTKIL